MASILIVDDEPDIGELVGRHARREGHEVCVASSGEEAVRLCDERAFDVVVMDVMMPGMDGYEACRRIRSRRDVPVIMLSARGMELDKLLGFEAGVDDYLVKPFSPRELMARVNVVVSRHCASRPERAAGILEFGRLRIDMPAHCVYVDGERVEMTAKEYDVLVYLAQRPGMVCTRPALLSGVWGYDCPGEDRTVDWQIKLLRSSLGPCRGHIATVRGVGYRFEPEA